MDIPSFKHLYFLGSSNLAKCLHQNSTRYSATNPAFYEPSSPHISNHMHHSTFEWDTVVSKKSGFIPVVIITLFRCGWGIWSFVIYFLSDNYNFQVWLVLGTVVYIIIARSYHCALPPACVPVPALPMITIVSAYQYLLCHPISIILIPHFSMIGFILHPLCIERIIVPAQVAITTD